MWCMASLCIGCCHADQRLYGSMYCNTIQAMQHCFADCPACRVLEYHTYTSNQADFHASPLKNIPLKSICPCNLVHAPSWACHDKGTWIKWIDAKILEFISMTVCKNCMLDHIKVTKTRTILTMIPHYFLQCL